MSIAGVVVDYVHGFALSEGLALRSGTPGGGGGLAGLLQRHPSLSLPAMRRAMQASPDAAAAADLEEGIDFILAGIAATIPPDQGRGQDAG